MLTSMWMVLTGAMAYVNFQQFRSTKHWISALATVVCATTAVAYGLILLGIS